MRKVSLNVLLLIYPAVLELWVFNYIDTLRMRAANAMRVSPEPDAVSAKITSTCSIMQYVIVLLIQTFNYPHCHWSCLFNTSMQAMRFLSERWLMESVVSRNIVLSSLAVVLLYSFFINFIQK